MLPDLCDPKDLDSRVTRQGVYLLLPAPNGIPWSEYVRTHRNRPQSISSSTEALESDHAKYVTCKIAQDARSMATHARSLPTDSPIPYFQPIERGYMSDGSQEGIIPYRVLQNLHIIKVVLNTVLKLLKQIEYRPIHGWMIMIPYLLLDMAEGH